MFFISSNEYHTRCGEDDSFMVASSFMDSAKYFALQIEHTVYTTMNGREDEIDEV